MMTLTPISSSQKTLNVYQTALLALQSGISFIPIVADGTKSPAVRWKTYQRKMPTLSDARRWFFENVYGIAFITGQVSGGLEMLDFDSRIIYEQFAERMRREGLDGLLKNIELGYKEISPRGVHLYYRCPFIEGNKKLAQRPLTEPPYRVSLIETRGKGGYSIGAPSSGGVHPSGRPYQVLSGSLTTIQTLQIEERALLLSAARALDEIPALEKKDPEDSRRSQKKPQPGNNGRRPGTIFNERATWHEILEPHGWTWVSRIGEEDFWRRPGKDSGISATTNYEGCDYLYVFSTSTIFESHVGISKFAAYTFLEHNGDFSIATKTLAARGYSEEEIWLTDDRNRG